MTEEFTWVNFPPTAKKKRFCYPKPETRLGANSIPLSSPSTARPILLEKWVAYCNGKAPSQQAGNPLHSCENGRSPSGCKQLGSPPSISAMDFGHLQWGTLPIFRGRTLNHGTINYLLNGMILEGEVLFSFHDGDTPQKLTF